MTSRSDPRLRGPRPSLRVLTRPGDDSGAAMAVALSFIALVTIMTTLIVGAVVAQVGPALFGQASTRTAHGAEAGLDVALGALRAATVPDPLDPTVLYGDPALLPCPNGARQWTASGNVDATGSGSSYTVTVRYYLEDPTGQTDDWLNVNALSCLPAGGLASSPQYALLQSDGTGGGVLRGNGASADRSLQSVYRFAGVMRNVAGGAVHVGDTPAGVSLCLDSGSAAPAAGTPVTGEPCDAADAGQAFWWRGDYTLVQTSTMASGSDMCVTFDTTSTAASRPLVMQACTGLPPQRWGYNDDGRFLAVPDTQRWCIAYATAASALVARQDACAWWSGGPQFPEPAVGAAAAGAVPAELVDGEPYQWVNFDEFSRCFDVSWWDINTTQLIVYPCKQDPSSYPGWNQMMSWDSVTRRLSIRYGWVNQNYRDANLGVVCARAPAQGATDLHVTMAPCESPASARQQWTVNRGTGDYDTSYTVVDGYGRCLSLIPPVPGWWHPWSTVSVETCDGSKRQKWNAPAWFTPGGAEAIEELP